MNELIAINYENERPTVSGRELHEALGIETVGDTIALIEKYMA